MAKLQLSMALMMNDRSRPIIDGTVRPEDIDLTVTTGQSAGEIFGRQLRFKEFDVAELSFSETLMVTSRGDRTWVMLPVFMTRKFFHTSFLVRADAGINEPADLRGKRVGVHEYIQTAVLWARGVLQDEFGVRQQEIEWHQERTELTGHSSMYGLQSSGLFQHIPDDKSIGSMLLAGELDAVVNYHADPTLLNRSNVDVSRHPSVRPLFRDARAEGIRYYQKTGIFPMNHGPVIRRSIVERHPWVVANLYNAFVAAKKVAAARMREAAEVRASLGWLTPEARAMVDKDPLPYGVESNRKTLETCARHSYEQGLSPRLVDLEEVFAAGMPDA